MTTGKEFDEKSDDQEVVNVSIDLPEWMVDRLDEEVENLAISREALVNMWIVDKLEKA